MNPSADPLHSFMGADTDPGVERLVIERWRAMPPAERLMRAGSASTAVIELAWAGVRARHASSRDRRGAFGALRLGEILAVRVYGEGADITLVEGAGMDHLDVLRLVVRALEACGVRYVVGGSLASSAAGEPRATLDVDVMVDLAEESVSCVIEGLGEAFYADAEAFVRAIRQRSSVNIVHMATATKVDLFVMGATPIEAEQMARRQRISVGTPPADLYVYTPEDILLQKLRWYRLGGEVSERQWRDVLGIVAVQAERLDREYLRRAAEAIEVADLLARALGAADGPNAA